MVKTFPTTDLAPEGEAQIISAGNNELASGSITRSANGRRELIALIVSAHMMAAQTTRNYLAAKEPGAAKPQPNRNK